MLALTLLLPIVGLAVLFMAYPEAVTWREAAECLVIPWLATAGGGGLEALARWIKTTDFEIWNGWVVSTTYEEAWYEKVSCVHRKAVTRKETYKDAQGHTQTRDVTEYVPEHDYDLRYHPPHYYIVTSNEETVPVDQERYRELRTRFRNETWESVSRWSRYDPDADSHLRLPAECHRYNAQTDQGNRYVSRWDAAACEKEPTAVRHPCRNFVKASDSLFRFPNIDRKAWAVYDYPKIHAFYRLHRTLGAESLSSSANGWEAEYRLDLLNAEFGRRKEVNILLLVWVDQPREVIQAQQAFWQGGKRNDFIVGVVTDRNAEVRWADCITWTESDLLRVQVVRKILEMGQLDLLKVVNLIGDHVERLWERNRTDFRYLRVRAPFWVTLLAGILVLAAFLWVAHIAVTSDELDHWLRDLSSSDSR